MASPVPPLSLPATPCAAEERLASYRSPRAYKLYTSRTHREQLQLTGAMLGEALEVADTISETIVAIGERARQQRADFVAKNADLAASQEMCPICFEPFLDPLACENRHKFCSGCLRSYRNSWPNSPRLLCPLCRIPIPMQTSAWNVPRQGSDHDSHG